MSAENITKFMNRHQATVGRVAQLKSAIAWMDRALATPDDKTSKAAHVHVEFQQGTMGDTITKVGLSISMGRQYFVRALAEAEAELEELNVTMDNVQRVLGKGGAA